MKNDFTAIALSTAIASAALLLLTSAGAWAGGYSPGHAGYRMGGGNSSVGHMHPGHPYHRRAPSAYHGGPRGGMLAPGPRYGHPRSMPHPMYGRPMHGMPAKGMQGPGYVAQPPVTRAPGEAAAPTPSRTSMDSADGSSVEGASVEITGMRFAPAEIRVKAGETVTWEHRDRAPHTVTGRDGATLASQTLQPGGTFAHRFDEAGTYEYYCSLHPSMSGTVIVE